MSFAQHQPAGSPVTFSAIRAAEPVARLPPAVHDVSALDLTLRALRPILTDRAVTELCINRPGEAFVETAQGWRCVPLEFANFQWCLSVAKLVANSTRQRIDADCPLLSASLPSGAGDDPGDGRDYDSPASGRNLDDRGLKRSRHLSRHAPRERGAR
jgi:hypothetical protein